MDHDAAIAVIPVSSGDDATAVIDYANVFNPIEDSSLGYDIVVTGQNVVKALTITPEALESPEGHVNTDTQKVPEDARGPCRRFDGDAECEVVSPPTDADALASACEPKVHHVHEADSYTLQHAATRKHSIGSQHRDADVVSTSALSGLCLAEPLRVELATTVQDGVHRSTGFW